MRFFVAPPVGFESITPNSERKRPPKQDHTAPLRACCCRQELDKEWMVSRPSTIGLTALFALWFDPDPVIHGRPDALLAAKISLRGLDRNVAQQELYLFQFASRCVTKSRARPA